MTNETDNGNPYNEKIKLTRSEFIDKLNEGSMLVSFKKLDGNIRVMNCTLNGEKIPVDPKKDPTNDSKDIPRKDKNPDLLPVYDNAAKGWRSFYFENVFQVEKAPEEK